MALASVRIVITASAAAATSAGAPTAVAPAATSGLALSAVRFHTASLWPWPSSRVPMAAPILPRPAIPRYLTRSALPRCELPAASLLISLFIARRRHPAPPRQIQLPPHPPHLLTPHCPLNIV